MSTLLTKAGKKLFEQHLEQYAPADPLYEYYTDERGREKRRKRELPPGLSKRDAKILRSVKRRAHYLDKGFHLCGLRFGWTFFIGLIPLAGDAADALLNYLLVVRPAMRADLPPWLLRRMLLNNAVSAATGFVPLVGDVVLAMYKANSRNAALLEEFLRIRGEEFIKRGGEIAAVEEAPEPPRGGWWGGKKRAAPAGEVQGAAGKGRLLPPKDVQQVKPGAGMSGPEMRDALPAAQAVDVGETAKKGSGHSGASSGFSFFGRKKSAAAAEPAVPASGGKGRFVENVDS